MSNPARAISKQWKRSTKDISDEWKRNNTLRNVVYLGAAAAGAYFAAPLFATAGGAGAGGAAGAAGAGAGGAAVGGTGIGVGTGTLAASGGGAAAGGGFLGAVGSGMSAAGSAAMGGAAKVGGAVMGMHPMAQAAMITTGGQMLAGAMTPEPQRQDTAIEQMREQRRLRDADVMPVLGGGGYLGVGQQPSGAYTTPRPIQQQVPMGQNYAQAAPVMPEVPDYQTGVDVGRWDPEQRRWVRG